MFSPLNHLLLATILISLSGALLLDEREKDKEVLIVTGGFSSQGALSSVEVLATDIVLSTIIFLLFLGHPTEAASWCQLTTKK